MSAVERKAVKASILAPGKSVDPKNALIEHSIADALNSVAKAFRAMSLYMANNPVRATTVANAAKAFAAVWRHAESVELRVTENSLLYEGNCVYNDADRGTEGLPWILYRDGLRTLTFHAGFEKDSLQAFLEILKRMRSISPDDDDLVTLFWVANLSNFSYRHVEGPLEGTAAAAGESSSARSDLAARARNAASAESAHVGDGPPPSLVRIEDFDSTLYFLDAPESDYLLDAVKREYDADPRIRVVITLFEIATMDVPLNFRLEAVENVERVLVESLAENDFDMVAVLTRYAIESAKKHISDSDDCTAVRASIGLLLEKLSEPSTIAQLLEALESHDFSPTPEAMQDLFVQLRPNALPPLLAFLGSNSQSAFRVHVEAATRRLASGYTVELSRLIGSTDESVARGAIGLAAALATHAAVPYLAHILGSKDGTLRSEAVSALRDIGSTGALQALERTIGDADREVRLLGLRAISAHRHVGAFPKLHALMQNRKAFRNADRSEKVALFEAYGAVCGEAGVAELDRLLNDKGMFGYRESSDVRACAALALGQVQSSASLTALRRAADSSDTVVRNAVSRAMKGGA